MIAKTVINGFVNDLGPCKIISPEAHIKQNIPNLWEQFFFLCWSFWALQSPLACAYFVSLEGPTGGHKGESAPSFVTQ